MNPVAMQRRMIAAASLLPEEQIDLAALAKNTGKLILMLVATGAAISLAAVVPNLPSAFAELGDAFQKTTYRRRWKALRRLQKQRLVEIVERGGKTTIFVTEEGRKRVLGFRFEHLRLRKPDRWDKKWRIIAFDIPEKFQRGRRALRMKMKELGFYPLQKSVFVHPYPCKDEIDFVADFFGIGRYVNHIEAVRIDDGDYLKEYFHL